MLGSDIQVDALVGSLSDVTLIARRLGRRSLRFDSIRLSIKDDTGILSQLCSSKRYRELARARRISLGSGGLALVDVKKLYCFWYVLAHCLLVL